MYVFTAVEFNISVKTNQLVEQLPRLSNPGQEIHTGMTSITGEFLNRVKSESISPGSNFSIYLGTGFKRFLVTAGLIVGLWKIIWTYNKFAVLNTTQKRFFNFFVTAFSLALGLNLASSLKSVSVKARWWILSWERRPLDEVRSCSHYS